MGETVVVKKVTMELPEEVVKRLAVGSKKESRIFGLLKGWEIDPQRLKEELREE